MISLVITTSFGKLSLALFRGQEALFAYGPVKLFQADIAKVTEEAFAEATIAPAQIDRLIVDVGPGGTSSVRTGVAFANALSYGLKIPVFAVSSLEALCFQAATGKDERSQTFGVANSLGDTLYFGYYDNGAFEVRHGDGDLLSTTIEKYGLHTVCGDPSVIKKITEGNASLQPSDVRVVTPSSLLEVVETENKAPRAFPDLPIPLAELMDV